MNEIALSLCPFFLSIALIFNVNKWIYYNLSMSNANKDGVTDDESERRLDRSVLILNIATGIFIGVVSVCFLVIYSLGCS